MKAINYFRQLVIRKHVQNMNFPDFKDGKVITKEYHFYGKVQRVGFRAEMKYIADKIGVHGYVINEGNNHVYAVLQGTSEKLEHIIYRMQSEKRIFISKIISKELKQVKLFDSFNIE